MSTKIQYSKYTEYQIKELIERGKTPKICNGAWSEYKKRGGNNWYYYSEYGGTPEIKKDAKSKIYDISEFLKK